MPKFLEKKLKQEYGAKSAIPYKIMNSIGAMRGNKETAKGRAMDAKHRGSLKRLGCLVLALLACASPLFAQTYTIQPTAYQTLLDASGNPVASGKICTYLAGTSTPATTYTTSSGTASANPIRADLAGRWVAYLVPGVSYKFTFQDASGTVGVCDGALIRTVDNISAMGLSTVQATDIGPCEGRLTLTSGTPVTTGDVTAAGTIYFTPYKGNVCPTYDPTGGSWTLQTFSEISTSVAATVDKNFDLFVYSNAGVLTLEQLAWANNSTRATGLVKQDGIYVKSGQTSRRYVGTYRTTGSSNQTEDSQAKRFVWNYYNRVARGMMVFEATDSWTYTTATWRQARGSTANQVAVIVGVAEVQVTLRLQVGFTNSAAGEAASVSIKADTVGQPASTSQFVQVNIPVNNYITTTSAALSEYPSVGYHFYIWQEYSTAGGATTWYGDNGSAAAGPNSGMIGEIEG